MSIKEMLIDEATILDHDYACEYPVKNIIEKEGRLIADVTDEISDEDIIRCVSEPTTEFNNKEQADGTYSATGLNIKAEEKQTKKIDNDEMEMYSNTNGVCFCAATVHEQMVALKSVETKKIVLSLFPEFGSTPVTDVLLKEALHSSVNDEVIYTYLCILSRQSKHKSVKIITPGEMSLIFDEPASKMKQRDITKYDQIIGCRCSGYHWTLSVVIPSASTIIYFNPLGELPEEIVMVEQQWNSYLAAKYQIEDNFNVEIVPHARQKDSISCGVYCLKFAECLILEKQEVPITLTTSSVTTYREEIVKKLLEEGGQERWCNSVCRVCGKAEGPKVQGKPTDAWVCCDTCLPARWYHQQCLHKSLRKSYSNFPFNCDMLQVAPPEFNEKLWTVQKNEKVEVLVIKDEDINNNQDTGTVKKNVNEVDEGCFVIKRKNNYMRKCAGCGGDFTGTDVCVMTTELRLLRGE
ncbi:uncharacterized protein LOC130631220 isoform X2 [Hydractinia symbiolongicarpus]|uniref:uncharacterized protein LOC130631220 isoform X2 n=1 Tax=Hydractinia symbiolongicarpus TaxID=13093 RepID=UPI00254DF0B9|nr:uncharacterized protein LOC130631220 isoform X2 [Hydractinia symbiolongicarpus]